MRPSRPNSYPTRPRRAASTWCVLLVATLASPALAHVHGHGHGHDGHDGSPTLAEIGELSAAWWQWILSIPAPDNPLLQDGAVDCRSGRSGDILFLAGTAGGAATRSCTISDRHALLFPLLNSAYYNETGEGTSVEDKRALMEGLFTTMACGLNATLDGVPVLFEQPIVRTQSPPFYVEIIEENPYGGVPGTVDPEAVADGYWVYLPPLERGDHVLRFQGGVCDPDTQALLFFVDATYELHVRRSSRH